MIINLRTRLMLGFAFRFFGLLSIQLLILYKQDNLSQRTVWLCIGCSLVFALAGYLFDRLNIKKQAAASQPK